MTPSEQLIRLIRETAANRGLNTAALANEAGIPRSELKHVLSGEDALTVEYEGTEEVLESPPGFDDANALLGDPAGAATPFFAPDGTFDGVFVYAVASGGSVGDSGALCWYDASTMELDGAFRRTELLDEATVEGLDGQGLAVTQISVAYMTLAFADGLFPEQERPAPLQAGRMISVAATDLSF